MNSPFLFPGDKKGAKLTAEEIESISNSFDESLLSRLWGLSPASVSLPWLSSAVDVLTFAHSTAKSLIYELRSDGGDSLSSWYLDNSVKVLDVCNCISNEIERLCLRRLNLRIAVKLLGLDGDPLEEEIHQARDLLANSEGEGSGGYLKSANNMEELIRDLATSNGMLAPQGEVSQSEVSPVEGVVRDAIRAVSFVTAFIAGVISSALCPSSGAVVCISIPEEFPWGDSLRAMESSVIEKTGRSKERVRKTPVLKELEVMETCAKAVLEAMDEVVASGGGRDSVGRLREAAVGLEKATEAMSEGVNRLREAVHELFQTVARIRKEMVNWLRASLLK